MINIKKDGTIVIESSLPNPNEYKAKGCTPMANGRGCIGDCTHCYSKDMSTYNNQLHLLYRKDKLKDIPVEDVINESMVLSDNTISDKNIDIIVLALSQGSSINKIAEKLRYISIIDLAERLAKKK